jgi:hypothetical protein
MPPAAGEVFKAVIRQQLRGQAVQNVLFFRGQSGAESAAQLASELDTDLFPIWATIQASSLTYLGTTITQVTPIALDLVISGHLIPPANGQRSTNTGANSLAAVFTLRTGVAGKTHRGRIYFGGIDTIDFPNDILTPAAATVYANAAASILTKWGPSGTSLFFKLGVYSRELGGTNPYTVAGWQQVTAIEPQAVICNQRRRRLGVGM